MGAKPEPSKGFAPAPVRKVLGSRKFRWSAAGAAFLAGLYFLFQNIIVDAQLRPVIERELAKAVGAPVSIGSLRGGLTGNVVLRHISLVFPGSPWETHLESDRVSVNIELLNLLLKRKPLEDCFKSLSLVRPRVLLVKVPSPAPPGNQQAPAPLQGVQVPLVLLPVPKVYVSQGSFSLQAEKTPQVLLDQMNFDAATENGEVWGLAFQAHSPEKGSSGILRFNGSLHLGSLKTSGKVVLEKWPLASVHSALKELAGWELESGTIDAESPLVFQPGKGLWFDATTTLSDAALRSPAPSSILLSRISGRAFIRPNEITVPSDVRFQLGETPWRASGTIPLDGRSMAVTTLTDQLFLSSVFSEILKLRSWKVDGKGRAVLTASGPLSGPVIEGAAELGQSHVGSGELDSMSAKAVIQGGVLRLTQARGKIYDGDFQADGFMALSGDPQAPLSVNALLKGVDAQKLAAGLGLGGMRGKGDVDLHLSGSLERPLVSASSQMVLDREAGGRKVHYGVHSDLQLSEHRLALSAVIDEKAKLEAELWEREKDWEVRKFVLSTGKKSGKLSGQGTWPKEGEGEMDLQVQGKGILLQELPLFNDQFPDVSGPSSWEIKVAGTRNDPRISAAVNSPAVRFTDLEDPLSLDLSAVLERNEVEIKDCLLGDLFAASGKFGLGPEARMDLRVKAKSFPVRLMAAFVRWDDAPNPLEGKFTGNAHINGLRRNPVLEGDGQIAGLKVGDWSADLVEALLSLEQEKVQIKKLRLVQGERSLSATGTWDRRGEPGLMSLRISAKGFQLGKGPFLTGNFFWDAKTGGTFLDDWDGSFGSDVFELRDLKEKVYRFKAFSLNASSKDRVIRGKVKLGKAVSGDAVLDWASSPLSLEARLKVESTMLSEAPELTQFFPPNLKAAGRISGQVRLKKGVLSALPMEGSFAILDGTIGNYNFDRMEFSEAGDKNRLDLKFTLVRGEAIYELAGGMSSPKAVWDPDARIDFNGPVRKEKLRKLLSLLGVSTERHVVNGQVDGNLSLSGTLASPRVGFSLLGQDLQYDGNQVPSADLHFSASSGKILLEQNHIKLTKGSIDIEKGSAQADPSDQGLWNIDLAGSTQDLPIGPLNLTRQVRMSGKLALEEKAGRPTFDGLLTVLQPPRGKEKPEPFQLAVQVEKKTVEFKPLPGTQTQLVGSIDLSQQDKLAFRDLHLEHSAGTFSVDGVLDLKGSSRFVSDAKNIPIEAVGKWLMPDFPLSGTGGYHLIFDGTLDSPVFTASLNVSNGKVGNMDFDLLDGQLRSKDGVLLLGDKGNPFTLSRKGLFSFDLWGKTPIAFSKTGWVKVQNREMDINAQMDKGDFGIILLAGLAQKASGEMDFSAHVGGTVDNPVLTLDLGLKQCRMVPNSFAHAVEELNGRVKVRNNRLAVEDLNGRVGQGRFFISSPPIEESRMVLENFIPNFLDFRIQTVGERGLYLNIPGIMDDSEWGEIQFYGATPGDPLLITGPSSGISVIGTALLQSGHYTFPPKEKNGEVVTYNSLANVTFDLNLVSGNNAWYSNDFAGQYLELKINPGDQIKITGKDSDKTPETPGIKCFGSAGSKEGYLRYLSHEFKMQEASLFIPKGKPPHMQGRAFDKLLGVEVASAGGQRRADVDIWVDFAGTFGSIDFSLDSSPRFSTDPEAHQKILLSNIMFGRDMTGLSREELRSAYDQKMGQVATKAAFEAIDRMASNVVTRGLRPIGNALGKIEIDFKSNVASSVGPGQDAVTAAAATQTAPEASGNTLPGTSVPLAQLKLRKYLDSKWSVSTLFGANRDSSTDKVGVQGQVGLGYDFNNNLQLGVTTGQNDLGQSETRLGIGFHETLPDIIGPKQGDKVKPRFDRFDVYSVGPGKFQLIWNTDKVTKSELRIFDGDDKMVRLVADKKEFTYYHKCVIEGLDAGQNYRMRITVKDPNGNETVQEKKITPVNQ